MPPPATLAGPCASVIPSGYSDGIRPDSITGFALEALRQDPRRAISEDNVGCLVCGAIIRHLTNTHLVRHAMTSADYKQSFGYNGRRSLMAHAVRRMHADNAVRRGLAQMIRRRPIVDDPALRARGGSRQRAYEEGLRRRENGRRAARLPSRDASGRFVSGVESAAVR
jgi:ROS/MUCR transcriptional regulator protein